MTLSPTTSQARDTTQLPSSTLAFIGGGNMASAIVGGLIKQGLPPERILVVEPFAPARDKLQAQYGVHTQVTPDEQLTQADLVLWAVKPQTFREAAAQACAHTRDALHLSVAAGIRSDTIARWLDTQRVVRAMPNTPALVAKGISGLYAREAVTTQDRALVEAVMATTGEFLWMAREVDLDAVTALSGSGPAYVFYFLESMVQAGLQLGLSELQARTLAVATFSGAAELARRSDEQLEVLRDRVTSKGGTTYAAICTMEEKGVKPSFIQAMSAACTRAAELGDEFGAG